MEQSEFERFEAPFDGDPSHDCFCSICDKEMDVTGEPSYCCRPGSVKDCGCGGRCQSYHVCNECQSTIIKQAKEKHEQEKV